MLNLIPEIWIHTGISLFMAMDAWCWPAGTVEVMLLLFFICALIIVLLEPKLVGTLLYWLGILAIGFVGFWALVIWLMGL